MTVAPEIGMPVHFYAAGRLPGRGVQPQLSFVAYVHENQSVNLAVFDSDGHPNLAASNTRVPFVSEPDELPEDGPFCQVPEMTDAEAYELADEDDDFEEDEPAPPPKKKPKKPKKAPPGDETGGEPESEVKE